MEKSNEYRTTVVCIDSYENSVFSGRFYNPYGGGKTFRSLVEFLLQMDSMLDEMRLPQSFTAIRAFGDGPPAQADAAGPGGHQRGSLATFKVRILFRQNASWQGSVAWLEGGKEESFRSVLELVFLMNSALEPGTK